MDRCHHEDAEEFFCLKGYRMKIPGLSGKPQAVVVAALLFFIVSHPMTYKLVDSVLGGLAGRIAGPAGCPTTWGIIVHSVVYGLVAVYLL